MSDDGIQDEVGLSSKQSKAIGTGTDELAERVAKVAHCRLPRTANRSHCSGGTLTAAILYCSLDGILVSSREGSLASPEFDPSWSWNAHYLIVIQL